MKLPSKLPVALIALAVAVISAGTCRAFDSDLVEKAIASTFGGPGEDWAYTETTVDGGVTRVSRFDPRRPEGKRWHVVSVEGRSPTETEREEDRKRREAARERPQSGSPIGNSEMIQPESFSTIEETAAHVIYRFKPVAEDEDRAKFFQYIDATLKIMRDGPYVARVDMRSPKPFKPGFGVKFEEYVTVLNFKPVTAGGPILPSALEIRLLGKAFLVRKIDVQIDISYGDYEFVGDSASPPESVQKKPSTISIPSE